ncbi:MAG: PepSY domain-containing protein [Caulobacterales bacterium]|nr:PepSY domain-containing protein [Caulobacterales bacterium]
MTPLARLRRLWLDVHLWIGAGLLIVLVPLSVTGSILVWHDAIDRALYSQRYATSGALASRRVADYAAAAEQAFGPRARLFQLRLPQRAGDPVVAVGRIAGPPGPGGRPRTLNAWIDPPTARVLDVAEVAQQATMVVHRLHGSLLIQDVGRQVVGWLGWAMFVSSATGLWLWWPRHGGVLRALRWRRGASQLFNLHHMVGFWTCLPLAVLSLTGVYIAFPQASHALVGAPPPPVRSARQTPPLLDRPRLGVDQALAAASAEAPGAVAQLDWPSQGRAPAWKLMPAGHGAPLQVEDATGLVSPARAPAERRAAPDPTSRLMRQIHDGTDMGLAWRLVITAAGAMPTILGLSGLVMWLRRRARRRALRAA